MTIIVGFQLFALFLIQYHSSSTNHCTQKQQQQQQSRNNIPPSSVSTLPFANLKACNDFRRQRQQRVLLPFSFASPSIPSSSYSFLPRHIPLKLSSQDQVDDNNNNNNNYNNNNNMTSLHDETTKIVLECNQRLLTAIVNGDYTTYNELCSDDMTCIEPESNKQIVVGKAFHKYYFDLFGSPKTSVNVSMVQPHVRFLGRGKDNNNENDYNVAVVTYIRLNQIVKSDGSPDTTQTSETRVWEKDVNGKWKNCHFHKS